jgi:putative ABC transport system permease protein
MSMQTEFRHGVRGLTRTPGVTLIAILTLALGIGGNTAVFSVVYSVLLAPIPYPDSDRLLAIWGTNLDRGWHSVSLSEPNFWDLRELNRSFENVAALRTGSANLTGTGYPERLRTARVSAEFFQVLGVTPTYGRGFLPEDDDPGREVQTALVAHHAWRARFGSDPQIVGKTITLDDRRVTVVGVLPADRYWLDNAEVFLPLVRDPNESRANNVHRMIGRLEAGVTREAALRDMEEVAARLGELYPDANDGMGIRFVSSEEWRAPSETRLTLIVFIAAVVFLLLIACVNVANLLLARGTGRQRDLAVCCALGAGRVQIARRVLMESLLLGLVGAIAGSLLAHWGVALLKAYGGGAIPRIQEVTINGWVLGFTLLTALVASVLAGLFPAVKMPFTDIVSALREGDRGVRGSRPQRRMRSLLVGTEVALSLMLLVGAGLMVRSFQLVQRVELGFESENRLAFRVNLPDSYRERDAMRALLMRFLERIESIPQVTSAAAVHMMPLAPGTTNTGIVPEEKQGDPGDWQSSFGRGKNPSGGALSLTGWSGP